MDEFSVGRPLRYKSGKIYERRQRFLSEALALVDERGLDGFSVRELCLRAGIAQKTLYNAYGSKDNVIALAMRQRLNETLSRTDFRFERTTIDGLLERLLRVNSRVIRKPSYTKTLMSVYYSPTANKTVRSLMRDMVEDLFGEYVDQLAADKQLRQGVSRESTIYFLLTELSAVTADWCLGDLADQPFLDRLCESSMIVLSACASGVAQKQAAEWLADIRTERPGWRKMRSIVERPPSLPARAAN